MEGLYNYSYAEIDIVSYLSNFEKERKQKIESLGKHKYSINIELGTIPEEHLYSFL